MKQFERLKIEKLASASEAQVTGEITLEFLNESRKKALKSLNDRANIPGFRSGKVPEDVLVKNLGEMKIVEETAEVALGDAYGEIMKEAKLSPIGRPEISITKIAPGIPLEFKIKVSLEPEFTLPDYKNLARKTKVDEKDMEVTDKEVEDVLEEIKKRDWKPDVKEGENLNEKVKENILNEKKLRIKEKHRMEIVEKLVKSTEIPLPQVLVISELEKMMGQFKDDVVRLGLTWEKYLESIKKSEDEIRGEWFEKAKDRAKAELIIMKIAETEKIEPSVEDLEHEVKHLLSHYPDADPLRARIYVYGLLRNQKVLEFLESLTDTKI
ncbi:hypothetical protein KW790_01245 [Candidatus Parcubacteria bacterium]|nr:hypothetical protein [Candidatus Parcubacteria bacterium]